MPAISVEGRTNSIQKRLNKEYLFRARKEWRRYRVRPCLIEVYGGVDWILSPVSPTYSVFGMFFMGVLHIPWDIISTKTGVYRITGEGCYLIS